MKKLSKAKKALTKKVKKGVRGYPIATIAFYGPNNKQASKVVVSIFKHDDAEPEPMRKWYSTVDIRYDDEVLEEILVFIANNDAHSVAMIDKIIGCPHQEGIDYPEGKACPECSYWAGRDRWTDELVH